MTLGFRLGDSSDSRLCGVEAEFDYDMVQLIRSLLAAGRFDFLVAPLVDPAYRSSLSENHNAEPFANILPVSGSDVKVPPTEWNETIFGKISSWIDLDSEDETLRMDSEIALKQEITWASYLSLQACLLPTPKGKSWVNYARCVNQLLQGLKNMQLWLRIPVGKPDDDSSVISSTLVDPWQIWNSFRQLCEHQSKLCVALETLNPLPSDNSLERWFGEPVAAAILRTDVFLTKADGDEIGKYLPERHQKLITRFLDHSVQIIISEKYGELKTVRDPTVPVSAIESKLHHLRHYREHAGYLYQQMGPLPEQERFEFALRDVLQSPLQPLKNNLDSQRYENLEKNSAKYVQYRRAICQALLDRVPDENASETTTVLMVVGAGRGPLVRISFQAAKETRRKLKVYAVEKNPNAVVALKGLIESENYADLVTIVSGDMRYWNAPETADILVSEMLGSFGNDDLSPECLDGAQRFLKEDGISIPSSYTSFLQPVTASNLYTNVQKHKDISHFEAVYFTKIHNAARLVPSQPAFTFTHPKHLDTESNERYKKLLFVIPKNTGSIMVHGFAGYFDAILYKDVHIGIEPSTATPNLLTWFPMFFPLRTPIVVDRGSTLEAHFWRCCDSTKVWYEWCVTSPSLSPIYNSNGRSHRMEL